MRNRILVIVATILATTVHQARAEDRYYMMIFASQGEPNLPKLAHTFAVFVKASGERKDSKIDTHGISWLPKSLVIDPLRLKPEPGVNLDLAASLKFAKSHEARVTMWGPFLVQKKAYDLALKRIEFLNSGKIAYVVLDRRFRGGEASNCIHAVSDLDIEQPLLATGAAHGEASSELVLRHLERWIVPSKQDPGWLVDRLDLQKDKVRRVTMERSR
jgi:hypothetical protein